MRLALNSVRPAPVEGQRFNACFDKLSTNGAPRACFDKLSTNGVNARLHAYTFTRLHVCTFARVTGVYTRLHALTPAHTH